MLHPFFAVNLSGVGDYWGVILTDFLYFEITHQVDEMGRISLCAIT